MHWFRSLVARVRALAGRTRLERELDEELQTHFEMVVDDYVRTGLPVDEARRKARLRLGGADQTREAVRDVRAASLLGDRVVQDVWHALRRMRSTASFSAAAILTIALAVGLNTAIFSVTNAVLLRPLPYEDPDRLMLVGKGEANEPHPAGLSEPELNDWRERNRVFSGMATTSPWLCGLVVPGGVDSRSVNGRSMAWNRSLVPTPSRFGETATSARQKWTTSSRRLARASDQLHDDHLRPVHNLC